MILTLIAVVVIVAAVGVAGRYGDRAAAAAAERRAAQFLAGPFGHPATVRVRRRPFLTQAVRGVYRDVEVVGTLTVGDIAGAALVAHLVNAHLPARRLVGGRVGELPCDRIEGRLVIPYAELARATRVPALSLAFEGERLMATLQMQLPGTPAAPLTALLSAFVPIPLPVGHLTRIVGEALLSLDDSGAVWLRLRNVSVGGIVVPSAVLAQLLPALAFRIPMARLPWGLRLDELRPTATGLVVDGSAAAVVIR